MRPSEEISFYENLGFPVIGTSDNQHKTCLKGSLRTGYSQPPLTRPRPGRRRSRVSFNACQVLSLAVLVLLSFFDTVHAAAAANRASRTLKLSSHPTVGEIIFDIRPVPQPEVYRRAEASSIVPPAEASTDNASPSASPTSSGSSSTAVESASSEFTSPLPKPFDAGLGANYTQPSCPTFLKSMMANDTFTSCMPFSLLLQNSMSFFTTTKSFSSITTALNASCDIVFPTCSSVMSSYATTLRSRSACLQDYDRENPMVRQAYAGLLSYDVLYHASCLKNTTSTAQNDGSYCFANAITNLESPTDSYIYYLPVGMTLPAGSLPTCNDCLKNTMRLFASAASNKTQPLNLDYVNAAQQVNQHCGPNFANQTVSNTGSTSGQTSGASQVSGVGLAMSATALLFAMQVLLGL